MLKFLRWFMKLFRPDSSGYVKNIQDDSPPKRSQPKASGGKRAIHEKDTFFWLPSSKILEIKKNEQGLSTKIKITRGAEFSLLNCIGDSVVKLKKQGLSKVKYHLEFTLTDDDGLRSIIETLISTKTNISILHVNRYGDGFLYGERSGLEITEFEKGKIVLDGEEDNVFYEITRKCLDQAVPKKE